jgi:glycosyltransferase involved in cell wall biosynthesis
VEKYLPKCVDSLVSQTYPKIEIILIDDGSTDNTLSVIEKYTKQYENVRAHHRENGGLSAARNTGIELAGGEYIAFVDSDDWVDAEFIMKLYHAIIRVNADIAVCGYQKEEMGEGVITFDKSEIISSHVAMRILGDIYPKENVLMVIACNKLYRRELLLKEEFQEGMIHEDEHISHRLIGQSEAIAVITDALYHYRIRVGSITTAEKSQNLRRLDYLKALRNRMDYCHCMMYGDLLIYMLYTFFEGMKQLMVAFSDDAIKENQLYRIFRREALSVYLRFFSELDKYQKKDYLKLIIFPKRYRENVIRLSKTSNKNKE